MSYLISETEKNTRTIKADKANCIDYANKNKTLCQNSYPFLPCETIFQQKCLDCQIQYHTSRIKEHCKEYSRFIDKNY
jgi:hypothetical protein